MLTAVLALALQASAPVLISTLDGGKLKGEPTELAWSGDGTQLFLQTNERDSSGMVKAPRYFVMSAADGKPRAVEVPPAWAAEYWTWKSAQFAPGSKTFGIDVKQDERTLTATSAPMGGALAKGAVAADPTGGGTTADEVMSHAAQMQKVHVFSLTLKEGVKGELVGEFIGQQFLPGYTFGWSPSQLGMIAYANSSGRLALAGKDGQKQQLESTKNVLLPAWSSDGSKIAFLQRAGKNTYELYVVTVKQ